MARAVRMAFVNEWPWSYRDDAGRLTGFDVAIASECARRLSWDIEPREIRWTDVVPAMASGDYDLFVTGLGFSSERAAVADHSDPIYTVSSKAFVAPGNPLNIHSIDDMRRQSYRIGAINGAGESRYLHEQLRDEPTDDRVIGYIDEPALWEALDRGEIAVALFAEYAGLGYLRNHPDARFEVVNDFKYKPEEPKAYYWFAKGDDTRREAFNRTLRELKSEGALAEILERFGYPASNIISESDGNLPPSGASPPIEG